MYYLMIIQNHVLLTKTKHNITKMNSNQIHNIIKYIFIHICMEI